MRSRVLWRDSRPGRAALIAHHQVECLVWSFQECFGAHGHHIGDREATVHHAMCHVVRLRIHDVDDITDADGGTGQLQVGDAAERHEIIYKGAIQVGKAVTLVAKLVLIAMSLPIRFGDQKLAALWMVSPLSSNS